MMVVSSAIKMTLLGTKFASQIDQKSIHWAIEAKMQVGLEFGCLLERVLLDFDGKLGGKLGPIWYPNRENTDFKRKQ